MNNEQPSNWYQLCKMAKYDPIARETIMNDAIETLTSLQVGINNQSTKADELPKFITELREFLHDYQSDL
jgi:hypothetical protein